MLLNFPYQAKCRIPYNSNGFIRNNLYNITVKEDEDNYGYIVTADYDLTMSKEVNLFISLSSEKSINKYFIKE